MDKKHIQHSFNQAENYQDYASVQKQSATNLFVFGANNSNLKPATSILEFGCGSGILTNILATNLKQANISALDIATNMLKIAQQKIPNTANINWIASDIETFDFKQKYSLITANFSAQWLQQPQQTCKKLLEHSDKLLISVPLDTSFSAWRNLYEKLNLPQTLVDLPSFDNWHSWLTASNKSIIHKCEVSWLMFPTPLKAAQYFKNIGANASSSKEQYNLLKLRHINKPLALNFDIAYFLVQNKQND